MNKSETLKQLAAASTDTRLAMLGQRIESLRQAKNTSAEELAAILEPLAQAMAALTDDTRQTLARIDQQSRTQGETLQQQIAAAVSTWESVIREAQAATENLQRAARQTTWRHFLLAFIVGMLGALLTSAYWRWLAPPVVSVTYQLDVKELAEQLKPMIAVRKPSKNK